MTVLALGAPLPIASASPHGYEGDLCRLHLRDPTAWCAYHILAWWLLTAVLI